MGCRVARFLKFLPPHHRVPIAQQLFGFVDGGVVVVNGDTLTKYDRNLNLIKQVELKGCKTCVYKKEGAKKGGCPMMGKGMMDDMKESPHGDDVPAKVDAHSTQHP